jgi:hypothetical protein
LLMMNFAKLWEGVGGPGHWPDCDMLQIGKLSKRGPVGKERYSLFYRSRIIYAYDLLVYLSFSINDWW